MTQTTTTSLAAVKIAHVALFGTQPANAKDALEAIKSKRDDWQQVLSYAQAISTNKVPDYYITLPAQLKAVILDRDITRRLLNR